MMKLERAHEHLHNIRETIEALKAKSYQSHLIEVLEFTTNKLIEEVIADRVIEDECVPHSCHMEDGSTFQAYSISEALVLWYEKNSPPKLGKIKIRMGYITYSVEYEFGEDGQLIFLGY